jgi:hypothetical protein
VSLASGKPAGPAATAAAGLATTRCPAPTAVVTTIASSATTPVPASASASVGRPDPDFHPRSHFISAAPYLKIEFDEELAK